MVIKYTNTTNWVWRQAAVPHAWFHAQARTKLHIIWRILFMMEEFVLIRRWGKSYIELWLENWSSIVTEARIEQGNFWGTLIFWCIIGIHQCNKVSGHYLYHIQIYFPGHKTSRKVNAFENTATNDYKIQKECWFEGAEGSPNSKRIKFFRKEEEPKVTSPGPDEFHTYLQHPQHEVHSHDAATWFWIRM